MITIQVKDEAEFIAALTQAVQKNALPDSFLSIDEAAELLDCHANTIIELSKRGAIKRYKNGRLVRYKRSEVMQALKPE